MGGSYLESLTCTVRWWPRPESSVNFIPMTDVWPGMAGKLGADRASLSRWYLHMAGVGFLTAWQESRFLMVSDFPERKYFKRPRRQLQVFS